MRHQAEERARGAAAGEASLRLGLVSAVEEIYLVPGGRVGPWAFTPSQQLEPEAPPLYRQARLCVGL